MSENIQIDGLSFELLRSTKRKTIGVKVHHNSQLTIQAPSHLSSEEISNLVRKKIRWVRRKLRSIETNGNNHRKFPITGEEIPYMGRIYSVVQSDRDKIGLFQGRVHIPIEASESQSEQLIRWYKQRAKAILSEEYSSLAKAQDWEPQGLRILDLGARWGSCSTDGTINLNWKLVTLPKSCREYVIFHEFAHLKVHDHSNEYWKHLGSIIPDWEDRKKELEVAELRYQLQVE